jgi:hypothetical protein
MRGKRAAVATSLRAADLTALGRLPRLTAVNLSQLPACNSIPRNAALHETYKSLQMIPTAGCKLVLIRS